VLSVTKASAVFATPAVLKTIGTVVSTPIQPTLLAAFEQALDDNGWQTATNRALVDPDSAGSKYGLSSSGHTELKDIAQSDIDQKVDLIVAAGGLPAAVAVATAVNNNLTTAPPFIFLIGRYPLSGETEGAALYNCPTSKKVGGVDQSVPAQNPSNFTQLNSASSGTVTLATVGLIVNKNNPITDPEVAVWIAQNPSTINQNFIFYLKGENNDANSMKQLLKDISMQVSHGLNGLVISSDPYLRFNGSNFDAQLRTAASSGGGGFTTGWACYPYTEYTLASTTQSMHSTSTPALAVDDNLKEPSAAYYKLGLKAAQVLSNTLTSSQALTTWTKNTSTSGPPFSWVDSALP